MPEPVTSDKYQQPKEKQNGMLHKMALRLVAVLMIIATILLIRFPGGAKGYLYSLFREAVKINMLVKTHDWGSLEGNNIIVRYKQGDERNAKLVLNTAESFWAPVAEKYSTNLKGKIPVILYPSRAELNASFGWPASERAMGVYWGGAIRILSPDEWIEYNDFQEKSTVFESCGPMAHELTHLVIDYRTKGNYPRWFTEGLAQYEEYILTGFRFDDPAGELHQKLYPLSKMDKDFDSLPNQSLAYRQSLAAIEYIMEVYGEEKMHKIINDLSRGWSINRAFMNSLGVGVIEFEQEWHRWLSKSTAG